ncbi:hypothetical protein L2E82_27215 [Cichorium intybus]|uniref:Uncharacterized protein n=1 Tax=Cichorium intybus TaxID=13427 RepID=A0ACB9CSC1_CICIN|nr:hypothetical protein L2E82_27215 [Cichorium intybus]
MDCKIKSPAPSSPSIEESACRRRISLMSSTIRRKTQLSSSYSLFNIPCDSKTYSDFRSHRTIVDPAKSDETDVAMDITDSEEYCEFLFCWETKVPTQLYFLTQLATGIKIKCQIQVGRIGAPSRREIGHGTLAERALEPILPSENDFPYIIRVESTLTESNGSSRVQQRSLGGMGPHLFYLTSLALKILLEI